MKIIIEVPAAFLAGVKKLVRELEIPESAIADKFREFALNDQLITDDNLWYSGHVYPDRKTAERVADRLFRVHSMATEEFSYMSGGEVVEETFYNPFRWVTDRKTEEFVNRGRAKRSRDLLVSREPSVFAGAEGQRRVSNLIDLGVQLGLAAEAKGLSRSERNRLRAEYATAHLVMHVAGMCEGLAQAA